MFYNIVNQHRKGNKMVKNEKREEVIRVFRRFARIGLTYQELNPMQMYKRIDILCSSRRLKIDMLAVFDTLRLLALNGEEDIIEALYVVYFADPAHRLTRNEISRRISRLAADQHCDERTVYRRLERARTLYGQVRHKEGLLLDGVRSN